MRFVAVTQARYHLSVQVALPYPGLDMHVKTRPKFSQWPITDHLRDSAPNVEKYRRCIFLPCKKIEIRMSVNFWVILFLKLKLLGIF
jgi:hypothetical protein